VEVRDTSGGCGSFYQVLVVSPKFVGLTPVKQQRLVNAALAEHIGQMHGLNLYTFSPAQWAARLAEREKEKQQQQQQQQ
jgi:stress-induced morphogen